MRKKLFGLIYMSSYKIQLNIINLKDLAVMETLDSPSFVQAKNKSEVFEKDMDQICRALEGFKEKIKEYKIKNIKFYGNGQLIDELSASYIADQIEVRTGLKIKWLSGSQIVYAKVLSGMKSLTEVQHERLKEIPTYLLSLGSAMINLSLFIKNKFVSSWNLPLGPREINEIHQITNETPNNPIDVLNDYVGAKIDHLARQIKTNPGSALVIQHDDALSSHYLHKNNTSTRITRKDLDNFYHRSVAMPLSYLIDEYELEAAVAEHTLPNLVAIHNFVNLLNPKEIYITDMSVITGLLMQEAHEQKLDKGHFIGDDVIMTFAKNMSDRYLVDQKHADQVREFALHIFDRLRKIHMLSSNDRRLLALAATIDDVGSFVNQVNRYEQSAEIIEANKLIGLSNRDNEIVSEISRYQTTDEGPAAPDIGGHHYRQLDPKIQLKVAKLSAILRIATALDASHKQKIKKIVISLKNDHRLIIRAKTNADITLERWSFNRRAKLFENVFGIRVSLKQEGMNRR